MSRKKTYIRLYTKLQIFFILSISYLYDMKKYLRKPVFRGVARGHAV